LTLLFVQSGEVMSHFKVLNYQQLGLDGFDEASRFIFISEIMNPNGTGVHPTAERFAIPIDGWAKRVTARLGAGPRNSR
jgi:hypothetical protein